MGQPVSEDPAIVSGVGTACQTSDDSVAVTDRPPIRMNHGADVHGSGEEHVDLKLVSRLELGSGAVAMQSEPRR